MKLIIFRSHQLLGPSGMLRTYNTHVHARTYGRLVSWALSLRIPPQATQPLITSTSPISMDRRKSEELQRVLDGTLLTSDTYNISSSVPFVEGTCITSVIHSFVITQCSCLIVIVLLVTRAGIMWRMLRAKKSLFLISIPTLVGYFYSPEFFAAVEKADSDPSF